MIDALCYATAIHPTSKLFLIDDGTMQQGTMLMPLPQVDWFLPTLIGFHPHNIDAAGTAYNQPEQR